MVRGMIGQPRIWEELGGNPSPSVKASAEAFPLCLYGMQAPLGLSALHITMFQKSDTKAYCCTASPGALFLCFCFAPQGPQWGTTCLRCSSPWPRLRGTLSDAVPWKLNMLRDNYIPCKTRRDNYHGTIKRDGVNIFLTKNGGIITESLLRI